MKIEKLISDLQELQQLYPNAEVYFTDGNKSEWFETYFQSFDIDEENNNIEMLFDTERDVDITATTFTACTYEDDDIIVADLSTYDDKEEAIRFAKFHNWDEVVNDITGEVVWKR